jgi:Flp pilus assembly secretin CpaC
VSIGPYRGDAVPIVTVRESDTILRVRDGETAVLTGCLGRRAFGL